MLHHKSGIAIILPGTVARIAIHGGVLAALHRLFKKIGKRLDLLVATSSGSIVAAGAIGWNDEAFADLEKNICNLTRAQICVYEPTLRNPFFSLVGALVFVFAVLFLGRFMPIWVVMIMGAVALLSLALSGWFFTERVWAFRAPFSTAPLFDFLRRVIRFDHLFRSPIELRVLATDVEAAEAVVFSSKEPGKNDPDNPEHCDRFVNILRASSALLGFPWIEVDGKCLGDGEFWTDCPFRETEGFRKVLVLDYWKNGKGLQRDRRPESFMEYVQRIFDIMRDRTGSMKRERYKLLARYDPDLPEPFHVYASDELLKTAPNASLSNLRRKDLEDGFAFGEAIVAEQEAKIIEYLQS